MAGRGSNASVREAVARAIAAEYWGDLGNDWESQWRKYMDSVRVVVTDSSRSGISADEFLDNICAQLAAVKESDS